MEFNLDYLKSLIGQPESDVLEFKSSKAFRKDSMHNQQSSNKFISDLTKPVSAFLNSSGGRIIVGIEEDRMTGETGKAGELSYGVSIKEMTGKRLEDSLTAQIQPNCASYVKVLQIRVAGGEDRYAWVIDVTSGNTAYQAKDRVYYGRQGASSVALEDKDIRLRMLNVEKPKVHFDYIFSEVNYKLSDATLKHEVAALAATHLSPESLSDNEIQTFFINNSQKIDFEICLHIRLINSGLLTVRSGYLELGIKFDSAFIEYLNRTDPTPFQCFEHGIGDGPVDFKETPDHALYPGQEIHLRTITISLNSRFDVDQIKTIPLRTRFFIDNGFPAEMEVKLENEVTDKIAKFRRSLVNDSWPTNK